VVSAASSESHFLELGRLRYHYLDAGQGEPVVMVHGNPTSGMFFEPLIRRLRGRYRVVAPDHIGCGGSDKPDDFRYEYRLRRRIDDLDALIARLGLGEGLTLVLHDWGGMIGMGWATRHPQRVKRLVVLNTAAFLLPEGKKLPWSLWVARNPLLGPILVRGLNLFSLGLLRYGAVHPLPPASRRKYLAPYDSWRNRIGVLRFVQDIPLAPGDPSYDLAVSVQNSLDRFGDVPMLICWGEKDFVFDDYFLQEWRRRFGAAEVHTFADAGHLVLEDAGDRIAPLVEDFLERHPVGTP
jgi:haloalkane dehalogenase